MSPHLNCQARAALRRSRLHGDAAWRPADELVAGTWDSATRLLEVDTGVESTAGKLRYITDY